MLDILNQCLVYVYYVAEMTRRGQMLFHVKQVRSGLVIT